MKSSLAGRICVVTGANRGIGRATADGLAELGGSLVLVCRRREDGERVSREIASKGRPAPDVVAADLSSQASIRHAASEIQARYPRLHVLVNNAGIIPRRRELTVDGLEMQFAVNHLAYFLLTNLLRPQLEAGAPSRIVNVSSGAHSHARLDFADLQSARGYHPKEVYCRTKLANVLFTYELAARLRVSGVTVNCLTPGVVGHPNARRLHGGISHWSRSRQQLRCQPRRRGRNQCLPRRFARSGGDNGKIFRRSEAGRFVA